MSEPDGPGHLDQDHDQTHEHDAHDVAAMVTQEYWDERYGSATSVWSGNPNPRLVEHAECLPAGTALDVGSGEGADAIWLAARGWQVTAIDIFPVALDRAERVRGRRFRPEEVLIIGDSVHDVSCAHDHGIPCLAVETGRTPASALQAAGADWIVPDLRAAAGQVPWLG